eukprot:5519925-Pleurochrysis_carterae.AAC.1
MPQSTKACSTPIAPLFGGLALTWADHGDNYRVQHSQAPRRGAHCARRRTGKEVVAKRAAACKRASGGGAHRGRAQCGVNGGPQGPGGLNAPADGAGSASDALEDSESESKSSA